MLPSSICPSLLPPSALHVSTRPSLGSSSGKPVLFLTFRTAPRTRIVHSSTALTKRLLEDRISQENYNDQILATSINSITRVASIPAFADPLIKALEQARSEKVKKTAALLLQHNNLGQKSVKRLRSLLTNKPDNSATFKSDAAFHCLCKQDQIDQTSILELHNYIHEMLNIEGESIPQHTYFSLLWRHRHIGQFFANVDLFDFSTVETILEMLLRRSVENLAPAYIDGNILYFYTADGNLTKKTLEDEAGFRNFFREAQRWAHIPEWARIKKSQGREEQNPSSAS